MQHRKAVLLPQLATAHTSTSSCARTAKAGRWLLCALMLVSAGSRADVVEEANGRCMEQMGEFGVDAVQACVEHDVQAAKALQQYPRQSRQIVARCTEQMRSGGWAMVKLCADQDIEAEALLAGYAKDHAELLAQCESKIGDQGAAKIKACVERSLPPKNQ